MRRHIRWMESLLVVMIVAGLAFAYWSAGRAAAERAEALGRDACRAAGVQVPAQAVSDGKVVLNIAERAVARLAIDNDTVTFTARFGGVSHPVVVPNPAVLAIYARETGQGMALPEDPSGSLDETPPPPDTAPDTHGTPPRRGHLRVIK